MNKFIIIFLIFLFKCYCTVPQIPKIHKEFQMIATANPPAVGYNTVNLDEALKSRAMIYKFIDKPLWDE